MFNTSLRFRSNDFVTIVTVHTNTHNIHTVPEYRNSLRHVFDNKNTENVSEMYRKHPESVKVRIDYPTAFINFQDPEKLLSDENRNVFIFLPLGSVAELG